MNFILNLGIFLPISIAIIGWTIAIIFRHQPTKIVWVGISKIVLAFLLFIMLVIGEETQTNEVGLGMAGSFYFFILLPSGVMTLIFAFIRQYKHRRPKTE
ncbi:hypothetical protein ABC345_02360 [Shouchella sp. 1P09AA]|uniref:hypothetical protein n=1 Tax=unclassified Shouchella TaxID=2893065 RepID=UPI00399F9C4A